MIETISCDLSGANVILTFRTSFGHELRYILTDLGFIACAGNSPAIESSLNNLDWCRLAKCIRYWKSRRSQLNLKAKFFAK